METAITPTTFATAGAASAQSSGNGQTASNSLSADFETFLRLLTTQMKNQDPTNPQDSTEFISQLAGFSAVEQQVETNLKLQELVEAMTAGGMNGLANWIGADVRSTAATSFDGSPVELNFAPPQTAQSAYVSVKDKDNVEVAKIAISANDATATWDGLDFNGAPAKSGQYSFSVVSINDGAVSNSYAAETYSRVVEARSENGETYIIFGDGTRMRSKDVEFAKTSLAET